jgi:hypothetical protein
MPKAPTPKEIRDRYSDFANEWKDVYEEGKVDMRFVAGDPWEPADRRAREDAGRPCISLDLIGQYLNQCENNIRQTEIAIQVIPQGDGANDKTATYRQNIIRGIDYRSNGQAADITAFQGAIQRSYGYSRLVTQPVDAESFDLEIRVKRIPNPDCVLLDPDYKEADASDIENAFITDLLRKKDFKKQYPKAKPVSFESEYKNEAPLWIREDYIQVAEFWRVHKTPRTLLLLDTPNGPEAVYEDEMRGYLEKMGERSGRLKSGKFVKLRDQVTILRERETEHKQVVQYITNGVDIIEETPWAGTRIPILSCFGKELFLDEGAGAKRLLLSMTRMARDPQMLYAYLATQECEEAGMTPKAPFVGAKGQFESDSEAWEYLNKIPRAFVQYDVLIDGQNQPLPPPARPQFQPNFQEYEIAKDSASRSVQAAMGISPLPTAAQRSSEKSGVALERIQTTEAIGSFHFTDNYKRYLHNKGWQINELIPLIYDMPRDVPVSLANGTHSTMRVNDPAYEVQNPDKDHMHTEEGDFDVTISTGPSYQSQRDAESEFADKLIENLQELPQIGTPQAKVFALAVRMRTDVGPIAREIADIYDPPDPNAMSPQAQAQFQGLQQQVQQLGEENAALHQDRARRELEAQTKLQLKQMEIQADGQADAAEHANSLNLANMQVIAKIIVAELQKQSRSTDLKAQQDADHAEQILGMHHDAAHDVGMAALQHGQAKDLATQQADAAAKQQSAQAATASQSQASDQMHQQTMANQAQDNQEPAES